jgi:hypothetical protein
MHCQCGCGGLAPIAKKTQRDQGAIAGQPQRYICGHNPKGHAKPLTDPADLYRVYVAPRLREQGGCLVFTGFVHPRGYGYVESGGRNMRAHRITYQALRGPIPPGMVVMHSCDNPACCNIKHLSVGTQAENMADMKAKGRQNNGWTKAKAHAATSLSSSAT